MPAREVGGDFYDFFFIDKERFCFIIGDASGKGVPAAMFMAVARAILRAAAMTGKSPGECMEEVNNLLANEDYRGMFITVFMGVLNLKTGKMDFCNAGHNPPVSVSEDGAVTALEDKGGPVVGMMDGWKYKTHSRALKGTLFTYSDGVTEAMNADSEQFTFEKLEEIVKKAESRSPEELTCKVMKAVEEHAGEFEQSDDITILVISKK